MASSLFGKYAIADSVKHNLEEEPSWWWKINPVTSGMELEMSRYLVQKRILTTREGRIEMPPTALEIGFREVAMTFGGTNIPKETDKPVEDGGEPILKEGASIEEIEKFLSIMPRPLFMELWRAVGESYPYWGPADPNAV